MDNTKLIVSGVAVVAALAVAYYFFFTPEAAAPTWPGQGERTEVDEGESTTENPSEDGSENGDSGSKKRSLREQITIVTTPYTAYIGYTEPLGKESSFDVTREVSEAVVGYEWESLPRSIMFSSVTLPTWDSANVDATYEVEAWQDGAYTSLGSFSSGVSIQLPRVQLTGTRRFKVTGIDPALRICPGDRSFTWDVRFTFDGTMGFVRTPITEPLPEGTLCEMR